VMECTPGMQGRQGGRSARARLAGVSASRHFLRLAGALPLPKRIAPESAIAASAERTTFAGAIPEPKRTRRESAIFFVGLRTSGCFCCFLVMIYSWVGWIDH
ncbi:MAG TPA: hypothetical protein VGQ88_11360, partial [Burkholderiales bacterium]|nr:hypothetical protein [Burkholderiales bacterium]